ncbi:hypothetical protein LHJ74_02060 [Streptomyces sp. N2-109]|uniref:Uncharacterized protein n=1 Tax=Streptomyces gossypii TaxID=2883101 RepID=A0ABT2JLZ4_9ACTN|nr:hypothetical protein [Streptomyces gossypii]MCT2588738.1 hypothetical protein [Streptomyces gossypii]
MSDAAQPSAADVRAAAEAVKAALDRHLEAVERRAGEAAAGDGDSAVYAAFDELAAAGEAYDELLYEAYDEVTPFEIPGGDTMPDYTGPDEPRALTVFVRRDYTVNEPLRLLAQAQRVTDLDPDSADDEGFAEASAGRSVHAALGVLFGEYEPDEIATRHKEFGLEEGDATLWVSAGEEATEPGEWLAAPFDQADPERVICRFDVSTVFDEEDAELDLGPDRGTGLAAAVLSPGADGDEDEDADEDADDEDDEDDEDRDGDADDADQHAERGGGPR